MRRTVPPSAEIEAQIDQLLAVIEDAIASRRSRGSSRVDRRATRIARALDVSLAELGEAVDRTG